MNPYYQDQQVTIYHCDCRELVGVELNGDLVLTDPPYGISHPTDYNKRGRGNLAKCSDYAPVHGDNEPFDPSLWLTRPAILWGGNHYASRLPDSPGWLVWDKERPDTIDQSTCELAWTNCIKGVRRFRYLWNGCMRDGQDVLVHPTQKPVALFTWCLTLRWTIDKQIIVDPYCGSGSVLRAAKDLRRQAIGVDIVEKYCEEAAKLMSQEVLQL